MDVIGNLKSSKPKVKKTKKKVDTALEQPSTSIKKLTRKEKLIKKRNSDAVKNEETPTQTLTKVSPKKSNRKRKLVDDEALKQENADTTSPQSIDKKGVTKKIKRSKELKKDDATKNSSVGADTKKRMKMKKTKKAKSYEDKMAPEELQRTVFVGNLPLGVTRKDIERLFTPSGKVESVRLRSAIPKDDKMQKKVAVIKQQFSEMSRNNINAYVKFADKSSVEKALKLVNGFMFSGHHLQVDKCAVNRRYSHKRSIFVGNLPFDTNEDKLIDHFSDCGDIERVRIVRDKFTGVGKGFGFVLFKDEAAVDLALKLNDEPFSGRPIRVKAVMKRYKKFQSPEKSKKNGYVKKFKNKSMKKKKLTKTLMA